MHVFVEKKRKVIDSFVRLLGDGFTPEFCRTLCSKILGKNHPLVINTVNFCIPLFLLCILFYRGYPLHRFLTFFFFVFFLIRTLIQQHLILSME